MNYSLEDFKLQYPNDDACLKAIFIERYGHWKVCPACNEETRYHKVSNRKCYACQNCGYQLHPLANTIYHKSSTPLKNWFLAMYLFSASEKGISALELQRQLGCTYKCAWRILKKIKGLSDMAIVSHFRSDHVLEP